MSCSVNPSIKTQVSAASEPTYHEEWTLNSACRSRQPPAPQRGKTPSGSTRGHLNQRPSFARSPCRSRAKERKLSGCWDGMNPRPARTWIRAEVRAGDGKDHVAPAHRVRGQALVIAPALADTYTVRTTSDSSTTACPNPTTAPGLLVDAYTGHGGRVSASLQVRSRRRRRRVAAQPLDSAPRRPPVRVRLATCPG